MTPKLLIHNLILEVTRRCNLCCDHCLRGDNPQSITDMPLSVLDILFDMTEGIDEITFSGGEPSLNIPFMQAFYEKARACNCVPSSFYVVSNGVSNQKELAVFLLEEYVRAEDPDRCGCALSIDTFHQEAVINMETDLPYLKGLAFYKDDKEHSMADVSWPYEIGRAAEYSIGRPMRTLSGWEVEEWSPETEEEPVVLEVDTVYISVNGYAYSDCDLSYEQMEDFARNGHPICIPLKDLPDRLAEMICD